MLRGANTEALMTIAANTRKGATRYDMAGYARIKGEKDHRVALEAKE